MLEKIKQDIVSLQAITQQRVDELKPRMGEAFDIAWEYNERLKTLAAVIEMHDGDIRNGLCEVYDRWQQEVERLAFDSTNKDIARTIGCLRAFITVGNWKLDWTTWEHQPHSFDYWVREVCKRHRHRHPARTPSSCFEVRLFIAEELRSVEHWMTIAEQHADNIAQAAYAILIGLPAN